MIIYKKWALSPDEKALYGMKLFPHIDAAQLPLKLQSKRLREEVMTDIRSDPETYQAFEQLDKEYQEALIEFCMGNRGMNILYDPFFKKIFRKEKIERLERLLSQIMGEKVRIVTDVPYEITRRSEDSSFMIMDMLVQLADGAYVNLEIQRLTHDFPFERAECYSSDIMVYQYDQLNMELREQNRRIQEKNAQKNAGKRESVLHFDYHKMRPVYVIALMNSGTQKFRRFPNDYIHRSEPVIRFDTGLEEKTLKRYIYISLDNFRKLEHNELTELEAWMYFLASDKPEDIRRVIDKYPEFAEYYEEIIRFRYNPKELMMMVPEAIRMLDEGSFLSMVDRMQAELDAQADLLEQRTQELMKTEKELEQLRNERMELKGKNTELKGENTELKGENTELKGENTELRKKLAALKTK